MQPKPNFCLSCPLYGSGQGFVPASGSGTNGILVVGEAAGEQEEKQGRGFVGQAGWLLDRLLKRAGIDREGFRFANVLACRPTNNKLVGESYEAAAIASCHDHLESIITSMKPRVILALGGTALRWFWPEGEITRYRGYTLPTNYGAWLIPTYHPSYLLPRKGQANTSRFWGTVTRDIRKAIRIARDGYVREEPYYLLDPTPSQFETFVLEYENALERDSRTLLAFDIETAYKLKLGDEEGIEEEEDEEEESSTEDRPNEDPILRISFAFRPKFGASVPWQEPWMEGIRRLLGTRGGLAGWNSSNFDVPVLKANGIEIKGEHQDYMWGFHVLQSALPKGLEKVGSFYADHITPWKHLNQSDPAYYNCLMGDSRVILFDGATRKISKIVDNKEAPLIRGMDEEGNIIAVRVTGWHKQLFLRGQKWLRIRGDSTRQPIYCTSDHKIWTTVGWKEAANVVVGDTLYLPRYGSDDLIHGTLLGDGHVDKRGRLSFTHSEKQKEWFHRKRRHLGLTHTCKSEAIGFKGGSPMLHAEGWISARRWRTLFYPEGKKVFVPPPSRKALAVWYCDDGCLAQKDPSYTGNPRICLHGFSNPEDAIAWFKEEFGKHNVGIHNEHNVALKGIGKLLFFADIMNFVPPEMQYKLPKAYQGHYHGWLEEDTKAQTTRVIEVSEYDKRRSPRYCIDVDHPTHRFFTLGGLVKNCIDADATICCAYGIRAELEAGNQWGIFKNHIIDLDPILYQAGRVNGVLIDQAAQKELGDMLSAREAELVTEAQTAVPDTIKPVKITKTPPKEGEYKTVMIPGMVKSCSICGTKGITKTKHMKGCCADGEIIMVEGEVPTYHKMLPFNPASGPQLMAYVKLYKHPVGWNHKTGRASLGKKHIEKLAKKYGEKHRVYKIIQEIRGVSKTLATYVEGYRPDRHGKIYTTYTHKPATPRLASTNVNLQNVSKRGDVQFAKEVRRTIVAPDGYSFVEADSAAIEAVFTGWFMGDEAYIRLAYRGVHDFLTCKKLGIDFETADIAKLKKDKKYKDERDVQKQGVHLTNYGGSPRLMHMLHPKEFPTVAAAQEMQDFYFEQCPKLKQWHHETRMIAHTQTYLVNPWGYRGYFYDVFQKDREGKITLGGDGNKCVAYLPQGSAACFMMDNLPLIWHELENVNGTDWLPANCVVHDSYMLCTPDERIEWAMETLGRILTRPIVEMKGLRVGCEISVGKNWADLEAVRVIGVS